MKLKDAFLCVECDEIFEGNNVVCPSCMSRSTAPISGWITSWSAYDRLVARRKSVPASVGLVTDMDRAVGM